MSTKLETSPAVDVLVDSLKSLSTASSALSSAETLIGPRVFERRLGDTEASYFLPSRENGVNDMYLHLGCTAPPHYFERTRMNVVWAILRGRHPLFSSRVDMHSYEDIRFVYQPPESPEALLKQADESLEFCRKTANGLICTYLNGPRILSANKLSHLYIAQPPSVDGVSNEDHYDFLFCATHYLGDGMALHTFANEFFGLLGSDKSHQELLDLLHAEWTRSNEIIDNDMGLPKSLEERLPLTAKGRFARAAARIDFQKDQAKLIGGHAFPKPSGQPRHTIVPTVDIDGDRTKRILRKCKANGVSISSALFALCNVAWARTSNKNPELPVMMYSALNVRALLTAQERLNNSFFFLAIGYFNIVLPAFFPTQPEKVASTFWLRARMVRDQSYRAAKNPMVVQRTREMAIERGERARVWAKEDDEKAQGMWKAPPPPPFTALPEQNASPSPAKLPKAPSTALIGLSLLGNLDGVYKHANFPGIKFNIMTTGSRQRASGMLLFGYTFVGKLWVSLGYDVNGFEKETVDTFWKHFLEGIDEFLDVDILKSKKPLLERRLLCAL